MNFENKIREVFFIDPISIILAVVCLLVGVVVGIAYRKKIAEGKVGVAEERARKIGDDAAKEAEARKKEILLEAKEDSIRTKNELEREIRERRNELQKNERRLFQKEETLDKKVEALEKKEEALDGKIKSCDEKIAEAESIKRSQLEMLEKIPGVGKKTAGKMMLTLKGKLRISEGSQASVRVAVAAPYSDVITSLVSMGYEKRIVEQKIAQLVETLSSEPEFSSKNQKEKEDILFRKAIVELA